MGDQLDREVVAEGGFAEDVVKAVIAKGQGIKILTKREARSQGAYWVAIQIDPKTGKLVGAIPTLLNGCVAGY